MNRLMFGALALFVTVPAEANDKGKTHASAAGGATVRAWPNLETALAGRYFRGYK